MKYTIDNITHALYVPSSQRFSFLSCRKVFGGKVQLESAGLAPGEGLCSSVLMQKLRGPGGTRSGMHHQELGRPGVDGLWNGPAE